MSRLIKILFFALIVKPIVLVLLGLNIINRQKLPKGGPAVIAANHNSHLDTVVLMSLFPLSQIHKIRPVAAADYFLANRWIKWFSTNCIGIIPLDRSGKGDLSTLFEPCQKAIDNKDILIIFPEGSRGEPEQLSPLRKGLFHLLKDRKDTPVIPIVMHGLGKALPRGEALLVPFNCDVVIGEEIMANKDSNAFITDLSNAFEELLPMCLTRKAA